MSTFLEDTDQVRENSQEHGERLRVEEHLREADQAAVQQLGERYRELVPQERIDAMKELPTSFEDRDAFDKAYRRETGQAPLPGEVVLGYSRGTLESAHVATDHPEQPTTVYHERLHQMSAPGIERELGSRLDEGFTEDLAAENLGIEPNDKRLEAYPTERIAAHNVREMCGDEAVERAYFQGDTREIRACLDKNLGENGLQRLRESLDDWPDLDERQR